MTRMEKRMAAAVKLRSMSENISQFTIGGILKQIAEALAMLLEELP